jgi:hypothetical protein
MNDSANGAKAQIVEKLKSATNILVTVSADPSVDQLAACIATTMLLNKYKKSATAVFSGKIPSVLNFLKPGETIEKNTDSLRDFIIALDKSKADKLRYKVEDDVVKIFITPYRTSITDKDLKYSAGDFNVDLILALGVHHQQDLDNAITAHGRIFHDAVTMSINNLPGGDLGTVNWEDLEASSLSELITNLATDLDRKLLDADIATALLTGIVAETSRFSNAKTHPRTMNISSILLEAGAQQQLVNTQLQDLIGTVVNLEAGTEIKPTADTSNEPLHHNDVGDELIIDETGALKPLNDTAKPGANVEPPKVGPAKTLVTEEPTPEPAGLPELELPDLADQAPQAPAPDNAAKASQPAPATSSAPAGTGDDAQSARQAIEQALNAASMPQADPTATTQAAPAQPSSPPPIVPQPPQPNFQPQPDMPAASQPSIQPIAPNQPSYANAATTTEYAMPATPEHEPAPLGMSPADQAFTMPLPPTSSMPGQPQVSAPQQQSGPLPPPVPPPVVPPQFGQ